jgi:hypothetical protein
LLPFPNWDANLEILKFSGEINYLNIQVERNRKTAEELKLPTTGEPDPLPKVKELLALKTEISELRTEFINTKQTVKNLSIVDNKIKLANIQEKLQKVIDEDIEEKL